MDATPWEDSLLERKTENDLKDLLKTMVAFANSVRPGHVATILIGERDDGTVQGVQSQEKVQKTVRETAEKIYPAVVWRSRVEERDGKHVVHVEIEYSGDTPHFGGPAWVRRGNATVKASDDEFQRLIDYRSGKVRELAKWQDKVVTVTPAFHYPGSILGQTPPPQTDNACGRECLLGDAGASRRIRQEI